ncbi:carboxymuconolactone decarboxylase family protein [Micromonospora sp. NPDC049900]|uniref:carboxymuconolactone decarboxylase family protein n=1 Tax=unclassified Micromonospora TaxID=2617518 RepID=UPI003787A5EB
MSRIPRPRPDEMDPAQRALHRELTAGDRASSPVPVAAPDGRLLGPFNAMLLNPVLGDAVQRLGAAIRYHGRLSDRAREVAILTVAAHRDCAFEQTSHEPIALAAGLTRAQLAAIRAGAEPALSDAQERAVYRGTRLLLTGRVGDPEFRELVDALGADRLFELSTLVGYYDLLAVQLDLFGVS